jgi:hypothetical protein
MTSEQQILANRRNARKSTGPRTDQGKRRSRRNAVHHGLTAETIIDGLEDPDEYHRFAAAIYSQYAPRTALDQTLVSRLTSLLWRLRRATAIENGLLEIQCDILHERRMLSQPEAPADSTDLMAKLLARTVRSPGSAKDGSLGQSTNGSQVAPLDDTFRLERQAHLDLARCFIRIANLDNGLFERIGRYEARLWRLAVQTIVAIEIRKTNRVPAGQANS